jgi:hypothetical protein
MPECRLRLSRRGQIWYLDFVLGITAFLLMLVVFIAFTDAPVDTRTLEDILSEAGAISESLVSTGYPVGWTNDTVQRIGITDGYQRINETLLARFASMSYDRAKGLFGTKYDYVMFFTDKAGTKLVPNGICIYGYGSNGTDCDPGIDARNLVKVERIVILNATPRKLVIHAWN